jgi:hypothetical protein
MACLSSVQLPRMVAVGRRTGRAGASSSRGLPIAPRALVSSDVKGASASLGGATASSSSRRVVSSSFAAANNRRGRAASSRRVARVSAAAGDDDEAVASASAGAGDITAFDPPWSEPGYKGAIVSSLPEWGQAASVLTAWAGIGALTVFTCGRGPHRRMHHSSTTNTTTLLCICHSVPPTMTRCFG